MRLKIHLRRTLAEQKTDYLFRERRSMLVISTRHSRWFPPQSSQWSGKTEEFSRILMSRRHPPRQSQSAGCNTVSPVSSSIFPINTIGDATHHYFVVKHCRSILPRRCFDYSFCLLIIWWWVENKRDAQRSDIINTYLYPIILLFTAVWRWYRQQ